MKKRKAIKIKCSRIIYSLIKPQRCKDQASSRKIHPKKQIFNLTFLIFFFEPHNYKDTKNKFYKGKKYRITKETANQMIFLNGVSKFKLSYKFTFPSHYT